MNIDTIFIECLKLPVFARVEYLEAEQAKSNFSKETYIKILYDKWKEYKSIVFKSDLEKPFDDLVKEKGWEYAAITVYGDEPEPFEHIYSNTEYDEIETEGLFNNLNQNNFEWLTENVLWVLLDYIYRLYDKWETTLIAKPLPPQQIETKTPTAPAIALFCNLINEAEIIKKESNEIPAKYCKRICENYKLKYTDRVRQNFNGNKSKKHYEELIERILPCIDVTIKDKIQKHLDSRNLPNQKLYG